MVVVASGGSFANRCCSQWVYVEVSASDSTVFCLLLLVLSCFACMLFILMYYSSEAAGSSGLVAVLSLQGLETGEAVSERLLNVAVRGGQILFTPLPRRSNSDFEAFFGHSCGRKQIQFVKLFSIFTLETRHE